MTRPATDFLGSGWTFPVQTDDSGGIGLSSRERDIAEAIRIILLTPKGERVMRPEFGCQIHTLIFAPNDSTTVGLACYYVSESLAMWEPRIRVLDITPRLESSTPERLDIEIHYEIKATHDRRSLVFPFYRIPGE
jgi:phage baseplate assembly protein W